MRKRDSVKAGVGIDGSEGENFTKRGTDPWKSNPGGDSFSREGVGKYQDKDASFLRNKAPEEAIASPARDLWDDVEANQPDSGNRAIKSRGS